MGHKQEQREAFACLAREVSAQLEALLGQITELGCRVAQLEGQYQTLQERLSWLETRGVPYGPPPYQSWSNPPVTCDVAEGLVSTDPGCSTIAVSAEER